MARERTASTYNVFTRKETENAVALAMDLVTSERWEALQALWWDRLEGSTGFNAMVMSFGKQLELVVDEDHEGSWDDLVWPDVVIAVGMEVLAMVSSGDELPPTDPSYQQRLCRAAIAKAQKQSAVAS